MANNTKWAVDPTHTEIAFKAKHMVFTTVRGKIEDYSLTIEAGEDNFDNAKVAFSGKTASINTGNADRDSHLKGGDFFDSEQYPELMFNGTGVEKLGDNSYKLHGDLTIKETTKPITLQADYSGLMNDPWGNTKAGFAISGKINRKDWGLEWNLPLASGGLLVSEDITIDIETQLIKA